MHLPCSFCIVLVVFRMCAMATVSACQAGCEADEVNNEVNMLQTSYQMGGDDVFKQHTNTRSEILFATHHKTGTVLAKKVRNCLPKHIPVDMHWCHHLKSCEQANTYVHFMRDLPHIVASAYLYHKKTGEIWSKKSGSAAMVLQPFGYTGFDYNDKETYTDYLRRAPLDLGLRAEVMRFQHGVNLPQSADPAISSAYEYKDIQKDFGLDEIESALQTCNTTERCITVCLEQFATSYANTWESVFQFSSLFPDPKARSCIAEHDIHANPNEHHSNHVTEGTVSKNELDRILEVIHRFDTDVLLGRMQKINANNPCNQKQRKVDLDLFISSELWA